MRGFPRTIKTKQDWINCLKDEGLKKKALERLQGIYETQDDYVVQTVSGSEETKDLITKKIENPMPLYKQKGFKTRQELKDLMDEYKN